MTNSALHSFHIPVLGLSYSIDTPVKVARFGISSVISIMDDELIEKMTGYYCQQTRLEYVPITAKETDHRAKRITRYLNLVNTIVNTQVIEIQKHSFIPGNDLVKYFEMLPAFSPVKRAYVEMLSMDEGDKKYLLQEKLKSTLRAGAIDVNIMAKIDKSNFTATGEALAAEYSDASAALRGFADSELESSVVFSAGYNPRLYSYLENFADFFPDENNYLKKKVILKVSDYRSALVQGKILAKKGIWVSEYRIESGLNCGGHAFATDGLLLGLIFEEFKNKREELVSEIFEMCNTANSANGKHIFTKRPNVKITAQGGIGTANENNFLLEYYKLDGTGWGSPFLLVPEATNVDDNTLNLLATAKKEDYYRSDASPLGIPFNNFRKSSAEQQRKKRIFEGRPGSPCFKKFLTSDTEFTGKPICTASRQYQHLKIKQLKEKNLSPELYKIAFTSITEKDCLCAGLGAAVLLKDTIPLSHNLSAVAICPGPNLAYFSGIFSLAEMIDHIYGRNNILNASYRPNMFINELNLYVDYFKKKIERSFDINTKQLKYIQTFKNNLLEGIEYYKGLFAEIKKSSHLQISIIKNELEKIEACLNQIKMPLLHVVSQ